MERNITKSQPVVSRQQAEKLIASKPRWVIITIEGNEQRLLNGVKLIEELSAALQEPLEQWSLAELCPHQAITGLHIQATLREALTRMDERQVDALLISGYIASPSPDTGIITRRDIVTYYTTPQKY